MSKIKIYFKITFGLIGLSTIAYEIIKLSAESKFDPLLYFSQFTTQTNLFAGLLLIISAVFLIKKKSSPKLEYFRGASTVYLVTTGIAFGLLLTKYITNIADIPLSNISLHFIMPAAIIIDWYLDQPNRVIYFKQALLWLIYPIVYTILLMVRGLTTGQYVYPIFNPANFSWIKIGGTILGLLVMVFVLSYLISRFGPERQLSSEDRL